MLLHCFLNRAACVHVSCLCLRLMFQTMLYKRAKKRNARKKQNYLQNDTLALCVNDCKSKVANKNVDSVTQWDERVVCFKYYSEHSRGKQLGDNGKKTSNMLACMQKKKLCRKKRTSETQQIIWRKYKNDNLLCYLITCQQMAIWITCAHCARTVQMCCVCVCVCVGTLIDFPS